MECWRSPSHEHKTTLTSHQTAPPHSHSLMFILHLFAFLRRIAESTHFLPPFFPPPEIFIPENFNSHHPFWGLRGTSDPHGEELFNWVISSDLLSLNDPDIPTLFHRSSPDTFFAPLHLFLGDASGPGFRSPTNSTNRPSVSGLSPQ